MYATKILKINLKTFLNNTAPVLKGDRITSTNDMTMNPTVFAKINAQPDRYYLKKLCPTPATDICLSDIKYFVIKK